MTHENLHATIAALQSSWLKNEKIWKPDFYQNQKRVWGTCVTFASYSQHHMISVHNCTRPLTPSGLAFLIEGIETLDEFRFGIYANKKYLLGFYATAKSTRPLDGSTDHWFMIARSPEKAFAKILRGKRFLSDEEQSLLPYLESRENTFALARANDSRGYGIYPRRRA